MPTQEPRAIGDAFFCRGANRTLGAGCIGDKSTCRSVARNLWQAFNGHAHRERDEDKFCTGDGILDPGLSFVHDTEGKSPIKNRGFVVSHDVRPGKRLPGGQCKRPTDQPGANDRDARKLSGHV
jgi:hypothetical protein